ncbi:MAG: helix-turn-helix transcriptional regulator [Lachnospiraceae bacterium]|nr:helix-turn-helix transcriptional regulator [Lachnospiraceae bacterium]
MNIGTKIKELRKQRGITQEQLANSIGISFQAVSKWENNLALPDISLAPILAGYFGVSMDELFDFHLTELEQKVDAICKEAYQYRESDPAKSRAILEEGLTQYPDNDILLNNLLYVINYTENPDETIAIASKLSETTRESDVKYDALRFLAYAYKAKGDIDSAKAALDQIPEIYFTKLTEIAYLLEGTEKFEAAEKQKWISFENLLQMMQKLAECYEADGDIAKAIEEAEAALQLLPILKNEAFDIYVEFFEKQLARLKKKL